MKTFITILLVVFAFSVVLVPIKSDNVTIKRANVTSNRPFAGIVEDNTGSKYFVGSEACCGAWLFDKDINVTRYRSLVGVSVAIINNNK